MSSNEMLFVRAEIIGENTSGQKRVHLIADGADGLEFWTDEKSLVKLEHIRASELTVIKVADDAELPEAIVPAIRVITTGCDDGEKIIAAKIRVKVRTKFVVFRANRVFAENYENGFPITRGTGRCLFGEEKPGETFTLQKLDCDIGSEGGFFIAFKTYAK